MSCPGRRSPTCTGLASLHVSCGAHHRGGRRVSGVGLRRLCAMLPSLIFVLACLLAGLDWAFPPSLSRLASTGTEVLDRQDRPLALLPAPGGVWRFPARAAVPLFTGLLIAVEDRRFRYHPGVDPLALARATVQLVRTGRVVSGGSTLAMQAARLLEPRPRTLRSKLIEMARAVQLEARYGREGVLDIWLTLAPFGGNLEGIRAGSLAWFGVRPRRSNRRRPPCWLPSRASPSVCAPIGTAPRRPPYVTACWRSARAKACSIRCRCRCRSAAYRCRAMRRRSPPACRTFRWSAPRWTCRFRRRWSGWGASGRRACRRRRRSHCWWPMPTRARSGRCIPARGVIRCAPARSI